MTRTVETEDVDALEVAIRVCDAFVAGDCYVVTYEREGRRGLVGVAGVQAYGEDGEPCACDLTPEQHQRLAWMAEDEAVGAIDRWRREREEDAA